MAKIGTAHVEVKTVLNEDALANLTQQIEDAVAAGFLAGYERAAREQRVVVNVLNTGADASEVARLVQAQLKRVAQ